MLTCGLMQELGLSFVVIGLGIVVLGLVLLLITACCPESRRQRRGGYRTGEPRLRAKEQSGVVVGWRFRKSKTLGPFRLTLGQRGVSTSIGFGPLRFRRPRPRPRRPISASVSSRPR
jgi:Protein of unknown function (DUF4236)